MTSTGARTLGAIACCAILAGCGPSPPAVRRGHQGVTVSMRLHGDVGKEQLLACSLVHNYPVLPFGQRVAYDGFVRPAPAGRWKVKVKVKRCVDGRFQDSGADRVFGSAGGRFAGRLQPSGRGVFFARARYRSPAGDVLSEKLYFEVR